MALNKRPAKAHAVRRIAVAVLILVALGVAILTAAFCYDYWRLGGYRGLPPIALGVADFSSEAWTRRLRSRFPAKSPEQTLVRVVKNQGFEIDRRAREATYRWGGGYPCEYFLELTWTVDEAGGVRDIQGQYANVCL